MHDAELTLETTESITIHTDHGAVFVWVHTEVNEVGVDVPVVSVSLNRDGEGDDWALDVGKNQTKIRHGFG